jgi:hypothetical protein
MMKRTAVVGLSLVLAAVALAFDPSSFQPATFKNFQRQQPAAAEGRDTVLGAATPALAVGVKYTGAVRRVSPPRAALIETVGRGTGKPSLAVRCTQEIEVVEQGRSYWLPIEKDVLSDLSKLLNPGQELTVYVRYLGVSRAVPERLYLLVDFDAGPPKWLPRDTCFARQLFGIAVGRPLTPVLEDLKRKYGEPRVVRRDQANLYVFAVDLNSKTYVAVGDAGEGYRDRVFSVELTGQPGEQQAIFKTLRFGAPASEVMGVFGKPAAVVAGGEGRTRLELPHTACSVELRNGGLASVFIADDPNYFAE